MRFFASIPNRGARIGHVFCEWNSIRLLAQKAQGTFLHVPFSAQCAHWEGYFRFGRLYDELDLNSFSFLYEARTTSIDEFVRYSPRGSLLVAEGYLGSHALHDQYERDSVLYKHITRQRYSYPIFSYNNPNKINIAIHVRRGDIARTGPTADRFLELNFYQDAARRLNGILGDCNIVVYTNGEYEDFVSFLPELPYTLRACKSETVDFNSMCDADIIICSRSGFSYIPALVTKRPKLVCPDGFWHKWPADRILDLKGPIEIPSDQGSLSPRTISASTIGDIVQVNPSTMSTTNHPIPCYSSIVINRDMVNSLEEVFTSLTSEQLLLEISKDFRLDIINHTAVLVLEDSEPVIGGSLPDFPAGEQNVFSKCVLISLHIDTLNAGFKQLLFAYILMLRTYGNIVSGRKVLITAPPRLIELDLVEAIADKLSLSRSLWPTITNARSLLEDPILFSISTI
jgi:hypothetical protein